MNSVSFSIVNLSFSFAGFYLLYKMSAEPLVVMTTCQPIRKSGEECDPALMPRHCWTTHTFMGVGPLATP